MDPATVALHLTLIRLGRGALNAWERWLRASPGLRPDVVHLQSAILRGMRRSVIVPWEAWVHARTTPNAQTVPAPVPRALATDVAPEGPIG